MRQNPPIKLGGFCFKKTSLNWEVFVIMLLVFFDTFEHLVFSVLVVAELDESDDYKECEHNLSV